MKKMLIATTLITSSISSFIFSEMRYNPINNQIYSHPEAAHINQAEYCLLLANCATIESRMQAMNGGILPNAKDIINQCASYLKGIDTPTAHRLIADLNQNTMHYSNGTFMKNIFSIPNDAYKAQIRNEIENGIKERFGFKNFRLPN